MSAFIEYLKAVRGELTHVAWPSRTQSIAYTALVVAISIGIGLILGAFDLIFTLSLEQVITLVK